jgi:3-isopropylmalate/(R)-2-methylmalate dehydratase small subunit
MSEFAWTLRGRCYLLGDDIPHADGVIPQQFIIDRETDPKVLMPHLFQLTDPEFIKTCQRGDIIVAGKNFGVGQKSTGYIAMQALGLGLVCESMPTQGYRGAINAGLLVLHQCAAVTSLCQTGDQLEVTQNVTANFPAIPKSLKDIIQHGGEEQFLKHWWQTQN